jgi:hypothetical protein
MIELLEALAEMFGPSERFRPAKRQSWREIEDWAGIELPVDYKEFVDGYGDAVIFRHLFVAHPDGSEPLLQVMQEERRMFLTGVEESADEAPASSSGLGKFLPWAYHDFNGDVCFLVPPSRGNENWSVAIAFRQCPEVQIFPGGVMEFLQSLAEGRVPRGWPHAEVGWVSVKGSPLI